MKVNDLVVPAVVIGIAWLVKRGLKPDVTSEQLTRTLTSGPLAADKQPRFVEPSFITQTTRSWRNKGLAPEYQAIPTARKLRRDVVRQSTLDPSSTLITEEHKGQVTTYRLQSGDYEKLNLAQRLLLRSPVPKKWVLG